MLEVFSVEEAGKRERAAMANSKSGYRSSRSNTWSQQTLAHSSHSLLSFLEAASSQEQPLPLLVEHSPSAHHERCVSGTGFHGSPLCECEAGSFPSLGCALQSFLCPASPQSLESAFDCALHISPRASLHHQHPFSATERLCLEDSESAPPSRPALELGILHAP